MRSKRIMVCVWYFLYFILYCSLCNEPWLEKDPAKQKWQTMKLYWSSSLTCLIISVHVWRAANQSKNISPAKSLFELSFFGGDQQSLALNIIITTTCHFSHYNTVRAVPVTVWEDGWEEMCLYCNLAQRVCSLTQTRNFLWNAVKHFFLSSFFFFPTHPHPHLSLCLSLSLPPSIPPISLLLWHAFVTSDRRGRPDRYSDNMVSDPLLNASSSCSSISLPTSLD